MSRMALTWFMRAAANESMSICGDVNNETPLCRVYNRSAGSLVSSLICCEVNGECTNLCCAADPLSAEGKE